MKNIRITEPAFAFTAGPVDAYPAVLRGLSKPIGRHDDIYFQDVYEQTSKKLQQAMRSKSMPVILHAQTALGLEAAAASMLGPNDVLLNLASGPYGKGYRNYATRYAREIIEIEVPDDSAIDPAAVADAFKKRPDITVVSVVHLETPSGTVNPCAEISRITHQHGALTMVDAATSWAGMDASGFVKYRHVHHRSAQMPGRRARTDVARRQSRGLDAHGEEPKCAARFDFEHSGLAERLESNGAISDSPVDRRYQWPRCGARQLSGGRPGGGVGAARTRDKGRPHRPLRYGIEDLAQERNDCIRWGDGRRAARRGFSRTSVRSGPPTVWCELQRQSGRYGCDKVILIALLGRVAQPMYAVTALAALGGSLNAIGHRADTGAGVNAALGMINASA